MTFFEAIVRALLTIALLALGFYLIVWVLGAIGLAIPPMVENILLVILVLIAILYIVRILWPHISNSNLWPK